jgi:hypothetical protein
LARHDLAKPAVWLAVKHSAARPNSHSSESLHTTVCISQRSGGRVRQCQVYEKSGPLKPGQRFHAGNAGRISVLTDVSRHEGLPNDAKISDTAHFFAALGTDAVW